jgi:CheY-like chemotaxis protein
VTAILARATDVAAWLVIIRISRILASESWRGGANLWTLGLATARAGRARMSWRSSGRRERRVALRSALDPKRTDSAVSLMVHLAQKSRPPSAAAVNGGNFSPHREFGCWEFAGRRRATIGSGGVLANNIGNNSPAPKSAKKPLAGRRILLAEDEGLIALELERMLADFGGNVVGPVASVESVLENAERGGLDGAVLDVNLRGRQIFEILPKLQRLGLRLIITSGYDDVTLFPPAFRAVPRIPKPFDERELRRICERVFADPATL